MGRSMRAFALGALLVTQAQSPAPPPPAQAATPSACVRSNDYARTLHTVPPVIPPVAEQQHIGGTVLIAVTLDEESHLTGARIISSPSGLLNAAALEAARHAAFQVPVRDCRPLAGSFVFSVVFDAFDLPESSEFLAGDDKPTVKVAAQGTATRQPDVAYVHAVFETRDRDRGAAIARTDAAFAAFRKALSSLRVQSAEATGYYDVFGPTAPPGSETYDAAHEVIVQVAPLARVRDVVAAATNAGARSVAVRYSVRDKRELYDAALDGAVASSVEEAQRIAREHGMQLGDLVDEAATFGSTDTEEPGELLEVREATGVPPPVPVTLRMRVSVTYALRRSRRPRR